MIDERLAEAIRRAAGSRPLGWRPVPGGYTTTRRGVVELEDGRQVFVKASNAELDAGWLRTEHRVYAGGHRQLRPRPAGLR